MECFGDTLEHIVRCDTDYWTAKLCRMTLEKINISATVKIMSQADLCPNFADSMLMNNKLNS